MIGQLEGLCTQFPFQCALTLISVLFGNKFAYAEFTSAHSWGPYSHWCTHTISSVSCGSITKLVKSGLCRKIQSENLRSMYLLIEKVLQFSLECQKCYQ